MRYFLYLLFFGVAIGIGVVWASPPSLLGDSILFKGQGSEMHAKVVELMPDHVTALISTKDKVTSISHSMEEREGYIDKISFGSWEASCKIMTMDMEKGTVMLEIPKKEIVSVTVCFQREQGVSASSNANVSSNSRLDLPKTDSPPDGASSLQKLKEELKKELKEEISTEKKNEERLVIEQNTGRVEGKIIHGGNPLSGCKVKIVLMAKKGMPFFSRYSSKDALEFDTETDREGRYVFQEIPAGNYKIYWKPPLSDSWIRRMKVEPDVFIQAGKTCYMKDINTARSTVN